ncbi:MAG: hypothetical protein P8J33_11540, partial [Pirellulaceae bacterium]|nr:hypothetical protein [Pirellulaceae bacterium]
MDMPTWNLRTALFTALIAACSWSACEAQTAKKDLLLSGLSYPCGVAVAPASGTVFVSDSGHGEILRLVDGKAEKVVTGYNVQPSETELGWQAGPLGIGIMAGTKQLIVGSGGGPLGTDQVNIYDLADLPSTVAQATLSQTLTAKDTPQGKPQGDFYGVTTDSDQAWLTG